MYLHSERELAKRSMLDYGAARFNSEGVSDP
jgi:hypothetical protein